MITVGNKHHGAIGEYVGRPTILGNPFPMRNELERDAVCNDYEKWFQDKIMDQDPKVLGELRRLYRLALERPVVLVCYCHPRRCHAHTIANYLNKFLEVAEDHE